ncbi:MAG: methyltransferase domain-containing protein [Sediminibacterium sp.]
MEKHYLKTKEDTEATYPVHLYFCDDCGLTQLIGSAPPEVLYDNYVTLSGWKNQPHVQHSIDVLKKITDLTPASSIIEIGSNDGIFLEALTQNGFPNLLGVEPALDAFKVSESRGFKTINDFLTPDKAIEIKNEFGEFDMLVSRQSLEHISDLSGMMKAFNLLVKKDGYVLIEVPDFSNNLDNKDYGLWEEHVNQFTLETLRYFSNLAGFELIHEEKILFSGRILFVVGKKIADVKAPKDFIPSLKQQNLDYATSWPVFTKELEAYLSEQKSNGKTIAVYGASSRVFCLLNFSGLSKYIDVILEDHPGKQNQVMPGGRIQIVPGTELYNGKIDICLLAVNTENEDAVIAKHAKWVEQGGKFYSVLPPSEKLLPFWQKMASAKP